MKLLALILIAASPAFAGRTIVDETFKTTFSDYNQLDQMIRCQPGHRGSYPTGETLLLKSHSVALGYETNQQPFHAVSLDAVNSEPRSLPASLRPFASGCQPLLNAF